MLVGSFQVLNTLRTRWIWAIRSVSPDSFATVRAPMTMFLICRGQLAHEIIARNWVNLPDAR